MGAGGRSGTLRSQMHLREILQHNKLIDTIRGGSVKKVLGVLEAMAKDEPETYQAFCPTAWFVKWVVKCCKHLVLTHIRSNIRITIGQLVQGFMVDLGSNPVNVRIISLKSNLR